MLPKNLWVNWVINYEFRLSRSQVEKIITFGPFWISIQPNSRVNILFSPSFSLESIFLNENLVISSAHYLTPINQWFYYCWGSLGKNHLDISDPSLSVRTYFMLKKYAVLLKIAFNSIWFEWVLPTHTVKLLHWTTSSENSHKQNEVSSTIRNLLGRNRLNNIWLCPFCNE